MDIFLWMALVIIGVCTFLYLPTDQITFYSYEQSEYLKTPMNTDCNFNKGLHMLIT